MRLLRNLPLRPSHLVLSGDQLLIGLGLITSLLVNYRILSVSEIPLENFIIRLALHSAIAISCWVLFRIYRKMIRFFSSTDYLELVAVVFIIHIFSYFLNFLISHKYQMNPEIFFLSFLITCMYLIVSRLVISYLYFHYRKSGSYKFSRRILIYGTGDLAVFLRKTIHDHHASEYKIIAFIDNDNHKIGRSISGFPVLDVKKDLVSTLSQNKITDIIIAKNSISAAEKSSLLDKVIDLKIRVREITSFNSLISGFSIDRLAKLDINDLMQRDCIQLYGDHISDALKGKIVLVTGAAGSIGGEIVRKLAQHNVSKIICLDFSESALYDLEQELIKSYSASEFHFILADVRSEEMIDNVFRKFHPDFVYHAAAYKHVPMMEQFPWQAISTNVKATWIIAQKAIKYKSSKFVFISSDKAVNPSSVMGASKRLAEMIIQSLSKKSFQTSFSITRFGNVLGSNGSVVPLFRKQISEGGPVTVTHPEMSRYFMTISEACQLVLEASVMAEGGEIFVFDMGRPVKILDLARNMIRLAGLVPEVDIDIKITGLRPGEKLFEDLFSEKEKLKETYHEKILISNYSSIEIPQAELIISKIKSVEGIYEPSLLRRILGELVPEYTATLPVNEIFRLENPKIDVNQVSVSNIALLNKDSL